MMQLLIVRIVLGLRVPNGSDRQVCVCRSRHSVWRRGATARRRVAPWAGQWAAHLRAALLLGPGTAIASWRWLAGPPGQLINLLLAMSGSDAARGRLSGRLISPLLGQAYELGLSGRLIGAEGGGCDGGHLQVSGHLRHRCILP